MSSESLESPRITLESLEEKNELPVIRLNSRNTFFVIGLVVLGYIIASQVGLPVPVSATVGVALGAIGFDLVRSAPPYSNVTEWIKTNIRYFRKAGEYSNRAEAHLDSENRIQAVIQAPETTRNLTQVSRLYPPHGIIERTDGSYALVLRYSPPNMDFSMGEEYADLMNTVSEGYNNTIDFDLSFYATTRPVDMEAHFEQLAKRMDDPDVKNNEIFQALLEEMLTHRRQMVQQSDTEIVHFYFIVSVDKADINEVSGGDKDADDRSYLFGLFEDDEKSQEEIDKEIVEERRMRNILEKRAKAVAGLFSGGARITEDASIERVDCVEAAALLESYWTGNQVPLDSEDESDPIPRNAVSLGPEPDHIDIKHPGEVIE
ncbi:hypothetical protein [Halorhabdus rudnickae]|uniref:hypothetical protein n=1 Tax=Halorhabdus rudnickae TaxID=1775544 RepID=UPI00108242EB|nr:hypothetical protein [Halorhabdus rudnickae]